MRDDDVHGHASDTPDSVTQPPTQRMFGLAADRYAATARASCTSRCICSTSASTRVEAALAAQPGEEREPQLAVVEVAVEVEQVGLDEHAAPGHERRAHPDVGRGRPPAPLAVLLDRGAAGVDAVARVDERVLGHEVGGREAERAAALVAVLDRPAQLERRAEEAVGLLEVAGDDEAADVGRGDDLAVDLDERHDARLERVLLRSSVRVALGLVAEAEVLPDRDLRGAELVARGSSSMNSCGPCAANERSNGITTSSRTPRPAIRSVLISSEVSSFGAASGATTWRGCGSKVRTVSAPPITSRWPRCTPSNSPTATWRGRVSASGSQVTFISRGSLRRASACRPHAARRARPGRRRRAAGPGSAPPRRTATPWRPPRVLARERHRRAGSRARRRAAVRARGRRRRRRRRPIARAAQLDAVGVAEVGDQRAHVGPRASTRSRSPRGPPRARRSSKRVTSTSRSASSTSSPARASA